MTCHTKTPSPPLSCQRRSAGVHQLGAGGPKRHIKLQRMASSMASPGSGPRWLAFTPSLPPVPCSRPNKAVLCRKVLPRRGATDARSTRPLPWLRQSLRQSRRTRADFMCAVGTENVPADELWWGEGQAVQSLEIGCR